MSNNDDTLRQLARDVVEAMHLDNLARQQMHNDDLAFRSTIRDAIDRTREEGRANV